MSSARVPTRKQFLFVHFPYCLFIKSNDDDYYLWLETRTRCINAMTIDTVTMNLSIQMMGGKKQKIDFYFDFVQHTNTRSSRGKTVFDVFIQWSLHGPVFDMLLLGVVGDEIFSEKFVMFYSVYSTSSTHTHTYSTPPPCQLLCIPCYYYYYFIPNG